ncbi:MAG TPA: hypothetical protein VLS47_01155 [Gallionella sp.]|nr:hypothetical protein [Gallionella sp.]
MTDQLALTETLISRLRSNIICGRLNTMIRHAGTTGSPASVAVHMSVSGALSGLGAFRDKAMRTKQTEPANADIITAAPITKPAHP